MHAADHKETLHITQEVHANRQHTGVHHSTEHNNGKQLQSEKAQEEGGEEGVTGL